ncbi:MAG: DNA polymerase III subunit alpha [Anaerolineae bacterium]
MAEFAHLHVHTEFSLLDGLAKIDPLMAQAKAMGMDSLAVTDHGTMYGVVEFFKKAHKHGIKPIIGCELYVAQRDRTQRDHKKDSKPYHLTVLARNEAGYKNLMKLVTKAQLEGFYYKPRVDRELLEAHSEGLIVFSGCPTAQIPRMIRVEQIEQAREMAGWFQEVFGKQNFYLEVQEHNIDFLGRVNRELIAMSRDLNIPLVATNDVHYIRPQDFYAHEVLLCVQTSTTMKNPDRMRIGETFYLRSPQEMAALFSEVPEALANTLRVAEQCGFDIEFGHYHLPSFDVPVGHDAESYLRQLCEQGLNQRYADSSTTFHQGSGGGVTPEIRERLEYELSIIHQMGFDTYFLIVWDLCRFASENGIWWNVRGSGAGSIVAYALRITNIDPLSQNLIFERFLNPGRVSMPDIDLDFPDDQRDQLIRYTFEKYGSDKVAQIITFGTMGARAAIRDAGRALDLPQNEVDRVARLVPAIPGMPITIKGALEGKRAVPELKQLYDEQDYVRELLDTAQSLQGVARHASTHAAGVVVSDKPLVEYVPLHRPTRGNDDEALPVTQYPMEDVEAIGLLKIDFLGLATLTVMRRAAELIEKYQDVKLDMSNIPLDDPAIYELLSSGNVTGIFQVEGAGLRRVLQEMQPTRFEHIIAAISLYRPGPMEHIPDYIRRMHGEEKVEYRHPALEPILSETYAIIVFQEQIIQIARDLAGYDAGDADLIRKAVGKKKKKQLLEHKRKFIRGAVENGIPESTAQAIFEDIEYFARYGFNKAHGADYAMITCQTAYLKAKYPVEYMAALLSVERDDQDKIALVAADCHRMGIKLLPPDVNHSELGFTIEEIPDDVVQQDNLKHRRGIRFGLGAIKNVGEGPVEAILAARRDGRPFDPSTGLRTGSTQDRPFESLDDFCRRVDLRKVQRRALECLIKAGALDRFGGRDQLLAVMDRILSVSQEAHQAAEVGQMTMFGGGTAAAFQSSILDSLPNPPETPRKFQLGWEKELTGLFLSEHPLHRMMDELDQLVTARCGEINPSMAGQFVTLAGMVKSVRRITTRKGDPMAFAQIEDLEGSVEVTLFPRTWEHSREVWEVDNLVILQGKVDVRNDRAQVICQKAKLYQPEDNVAPAPPQGAESTPSLDHQATTRVGNEPAPPPQPTETESAPSIPNEMPPDVLREEPQPYVADASMTRPDDSGESADEHASASSGDGPSVSQPPPPDKLRTPRRTQDGPQDGESSGNGVSGEESAPANGSTTMPAFDSDGPAFHLLITLKHSEDEEADIQRIGKVYDVLTQFEGHDRFSLIVIRPPTGSNDRTGAGVKLDFPNDTTRYCVGLLKNLEDIVGRDAVQVQPAGSG